MELGTEPSEYHSFLFALKWNTFLIYKVCIKYGINSVVIVTHWTPTQLVILLLNYYDRVTHSDFDLATVN